MIKYTQEKCISGKKTEMKYVSNDLALRCQNCDTAASVQERINVNEFSTRSLNLHALHLGSVCIGVTDITHGKCQRVLRYDGDREFFFCVSKSDVYSRGLLDTWAYEVCGKGSSFRDALDSWYKRCQSVTSEILRKGNFNPVGRRQASRSFNYFLTAFNFPRLRICTSYFRVKHAKIGLNSARNIATQLLWMVLLLVFSVVFLNYRDGQKAYCALV